MDSLQSCFQTVDPLEKDSARIVFASLPSGPVVMVATPFSVEVMRLAPGPELEARMRSFHRALADPQEPIEHVRRLGRTLRHDLTDPVAKYIQGIRTLYIAADAPFATVPFGALIDEEGGWFADRYRIAYSPPMGGARVGRVKDITSELRLVAASYGEGGQVLGTSLTPLSDLSTEIATAKEAFPNHTVLEGLDARPAAIARDLEGAGVFHYSGHVVSLAGDSALVLAPDPSGEGGGRLLWTSRIAAKSLSGLQLAVLAACSTSHPGDENYYPASGMARAFMLAGVPQVVASSWDVDSRATAVLMHSFYQALGVGAPPQVALSGSASDLRKQPVFGHPYYWAAFNYFCR